jgi:hypothetical protein
MNDGASISIELSRLQQIETNGYSTKKGDLSAIVLIWDIAALSRVAQLWREKPSAEIQQKYDLSLRGLLDRSLSDA